VSNTVRTWKKTRSREIADCRVFRVREDISRDPQTGREAGFFIIENPDWVNVIALTTDEKIIIIEQFRHGTDEITLEIPGGMVDEGEDPSVCAGRELLEETGYAPKEMVYLGRSRPNPAIQSNWIYHYLALDCEKRFEPDFDEHEDIRTSFIDLEEVEELIRSEKITHSLVMAGFYRFRQYMKNNRYHYES